MYLISMFIQSQPIQIEPFRFFCRQSVTARERDDESSEDGHVESLRDDDSSDSVDEKESGGKNDGAVNTTTANSNLPRESIICCNYDPPVLIFDGSDWSAIKYPRGRHFAIGVESFNKYAPYYTKNNSPADVFGALNFMMSASLEHHNVADENSTLVDTLLVKIKQSSFPQDDRTPECIHANCFGKPNKLFCRFVIEYIAMSLFFDYWGEHSAASAPAPFNVVSMYSILLHIKLIVSNLNTLNFKCCTVFRRRILIQMCTRLFAGICWFWLRFAILLILLGHLHYLARESRATLNGVGRCPSSVSYFPKL